MPKILQTFLALIGAATLLTFSVMLVLSWREKDTLDQPPSAGPVESAQIPSPADRLNEEEKANIRLFERVKPAVCYINTSVVQQDFFSRNVMEVPRGSGSGFFWDKQGHVITNYHVIRGADRAVVTIFDGSAYPASLVGVAPEKDLAILKIDIPAEKVQPIELSRSANLQVGQIAYAIGNPFGLDYTFTKGIISALGREIKSPANIPIRDVIQTDAAINPGNSGGPLINSSGKLIGVNTAIYSPSGASAGIGFSIPVDEVSWVVPELIEYGELRRPSLGFEPGPAGIPKRLGVEGVLVLRLQAGGPAERAGLRPTRRNRYGEIELGDIILSINDQPVGSINDLILELEQYQSGQEVLVEVLRDNQKVRLPVILQDN